jgi:predicted nucleotidyltransferase component of viral defense system
LISQAQLQRQARQAGVQGIASFEIEVILTYLLQMFVDRGLHTRLAFKGGTFLRKMVFGPGGRLSTDLDFTAVEKGDPDDMLLNIMEVLDQPYHGLSFRYEKDRDLYTTEDGCSANPVVCHDWNPEGTKIKIQVSMREQPTLPVRPRTQIEQPYFRDLEFIPSAFPCLALEEVIAEKIRAGQQRAKIRDLWDLSELGPRPFNRELVRRLAVIKVWQANNGTGFDHAAFIAKTSDKNAYEEGDLRRLLRRDRSRFDIGQMIERIRREYQFLDRLPENERRLAMDVAQHETELYETIRAQCSALAADAP